MDGIAGPLAFSGNWVALTDVELFESYWLSADVETRTNFGNPSCSSNVTAEVWLGTSELESNRINALSIVIKENTKRFFSKN